MNIKEHQRKYESQILPNLQVLIISRLPNLILKKRPLPLLVQTPAKSTSSPFQRF